MNMKRIVKGLVSALPVMALLGGVVLVAVGAGMIYQIGRAHV